MRTSPVFFPWDLGPDPDFQDFLHPAQAFLHPRHVVEDPDLSLNEKRAILASWASDACAVEAAPALRHIPGAARPVEVDEILEALRSLDRETYEHMGDPGRYRRQVRRARLERLATRRRSGGNDRPERPN
jgi:hypothetical protein